MKTKRNGIGSAYHTYIVWFGKLNEERLWHKRSTKRIYLEPKTKLKHLFARVSHHLGKHVADVAGDDNDDEMMMMSCSACYERKYCRIFSINEPLSIQAL